jgi:hypothetical protein
VQGGMSEPARLTLPLRCAMTRRRFDGLAAGMLCAPNLSGVTRGLKEWPQSLRVTARSFTAEGVNRRPTRGQAWPR